MSTNVHISFDCLPLRSVARIDVPMDASPGFHAFVEKIRRAVGKHGQHNTYYLHRANYRIHLTNTPQVGMLDFRFEGTVLMDAEDRKTLNADLEVQLAQETCDWITEQVVAWFRETVSRAVIVEFDRFIAAGDLDRAKQRMAQLEAETDARKGFLGMGL